LRKLVYFILFFSCLFSLKEVCSQDVDEVKKYRKTGSEHFKITATPYEIEQVQRNNQIIPLAKDYKIINWINRDMLIKQHVKEIASYLSSSTLEGEELQRQQKIKKTIEKQFEGDVFLYVKSLYTPINVADKKSVYVVCSCTFSSLKRVKKELDFIQKKWQDKNVRVCAVLSLIPDHYNLARKPEEAFEDFPIKERNTINELKEMKKEMPHFLLAFDTLIHITAIAEGDPGSPRLYVGISGSRHYQSIYSSALKETVVQPTAHIINKDGEISWFGQVDHVRYHLDDIVNKKYTWETYKQSLESYREIMTYNRMMSLTSLQKKGRVLGNKIVKELRFHPEFLLIFSEIILKREFMKYRDVPLALKCCETANALLKGKNMQVLVALAKALYEYGDVAQALRYAEQAKDMGFVDNYKYPLNKWIVQWQKIEKPNRSKFNDFKKAQWIFSTKIFPELISKKSKLNSLSTFGSEVVDGYMYKPRKAADLVFFMLTRSDMPFKNDVFISFVKKLIVTKNNPSIEDHIIYAALAMYNYHTKKTEHVAPLMKKALNLIRPQGKVLKEYAIYESIYSFWIKKTLKFEE